MKGGVKKSYTSLKTFIDTWVKDTANFKSFTIEGVVDSIYGSKDRVRVVGTTKDGRFMALNKDGTKNIISKYDEKSYMMYDPLNDTPREELNSVYEEYEKQRVIFNTKREEIEAKFKVKTLADYKKEINI